MPRVGSRRFGSTSRAPDRERRAARATGDYAGCEPRVRNRRSFEARCKCWCAVAAGHCRSTRAERSCVLWLVKPSDLSARRDRAEERSQFCAVSSTLLGIVDNSVGSKRRAEPLASLRSGWYARAIGGCGGFKECSFIGRIGVPSGTAWCARSSIACGKVFVRRSRCRGWCGCLDGPRPGDAIRWMEC